MKTIFIKVAFASFLLVGPMCASDIDLLNRVSNGAISTKQSNLLSSDEMQVVIGGYSSAIGGVSISGNSDVQHRDVLPVSTRSYRRLLTPLRL